MSKNEINFMMSKLCCAIAVTLQIKKQQLLDLIQGIDEQLLECKSILSPQDKADFITKEEFAEIMSQVLVKFNGRFIGLENKIDKFS